MDEYLEAMTRLRDLLTSCQDHYWTAGVEAFLQEYNQLQSTQRDSLKHLEYFQRVERAICAGMGSLSDLNFSLAAGHHGDENSLRAANQNKDKLLDEMYEICTTRIENLKRQSN
ncbi:MAG TPA: hypothetical protein VF493_14825 [Terriglobales bacterium]